MTLGLISDDVKRPLRPSDPLRSLVVQSMHVFSPVVTQVTFNHAHLVNIVVRRKYLNLLPSHEVLFIHGLRKYKKISISDLLRRYAKLILPHVGLIILCIIYTLGGALLFYFLEGPNEVRIRNIRVEEITSARKALLSELWGLKGRVSEAEWKNIAKDRVKNLTTLLFDNFGGQYASEENMKGEESNNYKWTFPSAVFFAATTITTIGYGDLCPVTMVGRVASVVFGMFGVPLMLVTIADVGKFISDFIVFLYVKYYMLKKRLQRKAAKRKNKAGKPEENKKPEKSDVDELVELSLDGDEVHIPVTIILLIVVGYTALGGVLLKAWETDWSFFDSFYFSFITMTTVGFGDYVPRMQAYYTLSLIYIILGLAITTMCVDLAGSQYIKKIHYFGRKIRSAKDALRTMGELMHYAAFLRKKYGLTDEQLEKMQMVPDANEWQEFLKHYSSFVPQDINRIRYIDQFSASLRESLTRASSISKLDDSRRASFATNNNA